MCRSVPYRQYCVCNVEKARVPEETIHRRSVIQVSVLSEALTLFVSTFSYIIDVRLARRGSFLSERVFFFNFSKEKCENNRRYVPMDGGVLSLFVKFSGIENTKFDNIPIFGNKNRKIWKIEKLGKKMAKIGKIALRMWRRVQDRGGWSRWFLKPDVSSGFNRL